VKQIIALLREAITEQVDYRELLLQMTRRDLLLRYKQSVMGFGWAIFMPLVNTAVFSVIFTRVAPIEVGIPYPLFAFCGLLVWNFFASSLRFSVISLTSNPNLVTKVFFPREIFPFSAVIVSLVDFAVASLALVALMIYYQAVPGLVLLYLPIVVFAHVLFTAAIALLLAMGNLFYRDVKYLFEVGITVWMFSTSVVYPIDRIGGRLGTLLALNPMTHLIDAYRAVLFENRLPGAAFVITMVVSFITLMVCWVAFHRAEFEFAENI
jgi:ABC-type polysaccharide/polyol phosphate export permease